MLAAFFRAHLHQDFASAYPSANDAVMAGVEKASGDEREALRQEWAHFLTAHSSSSLREIREALFDLGCAWYPRRRREVTKLFRLGSGLNESEIKI